MVNMKLVLALLSVVALSTAAPQNYTSHFQIFQDWTTEPTPASTDTTVDADGANIAANSTEGATNSASGTIYAADGTTGITSVVSTFSADDEPSATGGDTDSTSGSTYFTNGVTYTTGDAVTPATDGANYVTDAATIVISGTDGGTETTVPNFATGSVFRVGSASSTEVATDVTSGSSYATESVTSTPESAISSTDDTTFTAGGATFSRDGLTQTTSDTTESTDRASNATDEVTEDSIGVASRSDVTSETFESTTEVVFETSTVETNDESSTDAPTRTEGEVQTTTRLPVRDERPDNQGNSTKIESDEVEEPGFGFTFKLPSFFTTILQAVPTIGSAISNTTSSELFANVHGNDGSGSISHSQNLNGGLTIDSTPPLTPFNSTTTTASPFIAVSGNSFRPSEGQYSFIPSTSFEASSSYPGSSGLNILSTSDFNAQETPFRSEHLTRVKKSLTESEIRRNQGAIGYSGPPLNPDYYQPSFTGDGRDNVDTYDYNYDSQSYPSVRASEIYEEANPHSGNSAVPTVQFQYIIRTSNLPGVLASFPASSSPSAVHSSSHGSSYLSQVASSTGHQSGVGHETLPSQPASHSSLVPAFQSSSSYSFASNPQPSSEFDNSFGGSSAAGHQHTNVDSASGTLKPGGSGYSIAPQASIVPEEANQTLSTRISESSKKDTNSFSTTESPIFDFSEATIASTDGAEVVSTTTEGIDQEEISDKEDTTDKPVRIF